VPALPPTRPAPIPAGTSLTGSRIAFAVYNAGLGSYTLYTVQADGSGLHAIADYVHQPDYSPNGVRIAVNGFGGGKDDLWDIKFDGSDWRKLTKHPDDFFPTWAPDGSLVVLSSTQQGDGVYRLYTDDGPVGTQTTKFILGNYPVWLPTWEIAFNGCDYGWGTDTHCGMWRTVQGQMPKQITDNPQDIPLDGTKSELLFLRSEAENWDIYRIPLGGGNAVRLTDHAGRDGPAAFSPDGSAIAFLSDRSGTWALYTMDRQGGNVKKLLDLPEGGNYDASPVPWTQERISWGSPPAKPTPAPTAPGADLLPAPKIIFPSPNDIVSSSRPTTVRWTWSQTLAANQGFEVRFWHTQDSGPMGVAPPTDEGELEVNFGFTESFKRHKDDVYFLDIIVVQLSPYKVLSQSAPIQVHTDPSK
jgi:WD40 repeat protein